MTAEDVEEWAEELVRAFNAGRVLDMAPDVLDRDLDPSNDEPWPDDRRIPAAALRATLLHPDFKPDPVGLVIRGAEITGRLRLDHVSLPCPLRLRYCRIDEPVSMTFAKSPTVEILWCRLKSLDLTFATIEGVLNLSGSKVAAGIDAGGVTAASLRMVDADVGAGIDFSEQVKWFEKVRASLPEGSDQAAETEAFRTATPSLLSLVGNAVDLSDSTVPAMVDLEDLTARGTVRLNGARIGGLDLSKATLSGGTKHDGSRVALSLGGAEIDSLVLLTDVTATGQVELAEAEVGQLTFQGASLDGSGKAAVYAPAADIRTLVWSGLRSVTGELDLTMATVGNLIVDHEDAAVGLGASLEAPGWQVTDVHGIIRHDRGAAARWLSSSGPGRVTQPWHQIAAVYERNGQPEDARWIRWTAARHSTRAAPWRSKPARWLYGALVGHGYYPLLAALWLVATLVIATTLISANREAFSPSAPAAAAPPTSTTAPTRGTPEGEQVTGATPCRDLHPSYPCFHPLVYSLDVLLPASTGSQTSAWRVRASDWLPPTLVALKVLAWLSGALLLAGVTGLLRKG